jgi:hypothetical protein
MTGFVFFFLSSCVCAGCDDGTYRMVRFGLWPLLLAVVICSVQLVSSDAMTEPTA